MLLLILLLQPVTKSIAQPVTRPAIVGIASVELKVSDVTKSYSFYEGLLGYVCTPALAEATRQGSFSIQVNQRQSIRIEGGLPPTQDERLLALGFETTDVEAMRLYLKSKGISVPDKVIKKGETHFFSIVDTDQHELKFIQLLTVKNTKSTKQETTNILSDRILHAGLTIRDVNSGQ